MQPNAAQKPGMIDVDPIIAKIQIPPNLKSIYDKAILSGMRIMFDKNSHQMMLDELDKPGPMASKLSNGIITLVYMLWTKSNKTLPPQIMVPITVALTLKAFDFLQQSGDPEATKEVLGDGLHQAVMGVMERFGVKPDQLQGLAAQASKGIVPPTAAPTKPQGGLMGAPTNGGAQ